MIDFPFSVHSRNGTGPLNKNVYLRKSFNIPNYGLIMVLPIKSSVVLMK